MAAKSKHYGDVYEWIKQVIDSCKTTIQLHHANKLIRQYSKQYNNKAALRDLYVLSDCKLLQLTKK